MICALSGRGGPGRLRRPGRPTWTGSECFFDSVTLEPLACRLVAEAVGDKHRHGRCPSFLLTIELVEVSAHARDYLVMVVVIPAVDLLREERQQLVISALADSDPCPRVAVWRLVL